MKRQSSKVLIIGSVAALLVAIAGPVTAKKPISKPEPAAYAVTLTFIGEETPGLSTTTCDESTTDSIRMFGTAGPTGLSLWDTETPLIHVRAPEVDWERTYPAASVGSEFNECHGPSVYEGPPDHPFADHGGTLMITINDNAGTVDFLWHFDYYIDAEDLGKKKSRWVATVRENYTMSATAAYNPSTGLVQGSFPVSWSLKEGNVLVHSYDLFPPFDSTEMEFNMEIVEITPLD
jgi:hypothetical protein